MLVNVRPPTVQVGVGTFSDSRRMGLGVSGGIFFCLVRANLLIV